MKTKTVLIGLGVLVVGAIGYGFYAQSKKNKASSSGSGGSTPPAGGSSSSNSIWDQIANGAKALENLLKDNKTADPTGSENKAPGSDNTILYNEQERDMSSLSDEEKKEIARQLMHK